MTSAAQPRHAHASLLAMLLSLVWGLHATNAHAQDAQQAASARVLFEQGADFADAGNWVDAEDRFRRALELKDSPVIAYNRAGALQELGRLVEASEVLQRVIRHEGVPAGLLKEAESQQAALKPRIARLTVNTTGEREGATVTIDGRPIMDAMFGVPIPVDPGSRTVVALRDDEEIDRRTALLEEGGEAELSIDLGAPSAPTPAAVAAAAPWTSDDHTATNDGDDSLTGQWWFWAGTGAVTIGVIILVAALAGGDDGPSTEAGFMGDFQPSTLEVEVTPR